MENIYVYKWRNKVKKKTCKIVHVGFAFESSHNITFIFLQVVRDPQLTMDGVACFDVDR